jgi:hypothetical protein
MQLQAGNSVCIEAFVWESVTLPQYSCADQRPGLVETTTQLNLFFPVPGAKTVRHCVLSAGYGSKTTLACQPRPVGGACVQSLQRQRLIVLPGNTPRLTDAVQRACPAVGGRAGWMALLHGMEPGDWTGCQRQWRTF